MAHAMFISFFLKKYGTTQTPHNEEVFKYKKNAVQHKFRRGFKYHTRKNAVFFNCLFLNEKLLTLINSQGNVWSASPQENSIEQ